MHIDGFEEKKTKKVYNFKARVMVQRWSGSIKQKRITARFSFIIFRVFIQLASLSHILFFSNKLIVIYELSEPNSNKLPLAPV